MGDDRERSRSLQTGQRRRKSREGRRPRNDEYESITKPWCLALRDAKKRFLPPPLTTSVCPPCPKFNIRQQLPLLSSPSSLGRYRARPLRSSLVRSRLGLRRYWSWRRRDGRIAPCVLLDGLEDAAEDPDRDGALAELGDGNVFREDAVADFSNNGFDFEFGTLWMRGVSGGKEEGRERERTLKSALRPICAALSSSFFFSSSERPLFSAAERASKTSLSA